MQTTSNAIFLVRISISRAARVFSPRRKSCAAGIEKPTCSRWPSKGGRIALLYSCAVGVGGIGRGPNRMTCEIAGPSDPRSRRANAPRVVVIIVEIPSRSRQGHGS